MRVPDAKYWQQLWRERERLRDKPDNSAYWDERAASFAQRQHSSGYVEDFLAALGHPRGKSILDFGAGAGTLALPLAQAKNTVLACDFSAGMLEALNCRAQQEAVDAQITTKLLAWDDNWACAGIAEKSVDIALASRSTMVSDLATAFDKLEAAARERVAVTMATEYTPHGYKQLGSDADGSSALGGYLPDYLLAMNLLIHRGVYPTLHYINSYKSLQESGEAPEKRLVRWAFISWAPSLPDKSNAEAEAKG